MKNNSRKTNNKNILITGATGFLGSHLLSELVREKYQLVILKRSSSDTRRIKEFLTQTKSYDIDKIDIETIFSKHQIEGIIHLATDYGKTNNNALTQMLISNCLLSF